MNPDLSGTIGGIIGSGIATAIGIFLSGIMLDRYRSPKLVLDNSHIEKETLHIMFVDTEIDDYRFVKNAPYLLHRIKIRNTGRTAAKNCNAILVIGNKEHKLIWKSSQKENTTINAKSYEYVEVCSFLTDNKKDVYNWFNEIYMQIEDREKKLLKSKNSYYVNSTVEELKDFAKKLKNEYPYKNSIPDIILPSENGWNELLKDIRRRYLEGYFYNEMDLKPAKIIVSSENAGPIQFDIKLNPYPDKDGVQITFDEYE
ncbi:MAG: hypothetical protein DA328_06040 [Nitrososphaeraceae archaeon]|nr:hypothetical protein [Nitrososphaeraceae archaeon]